MLVFKYLISNVLLKDVKMVAPCLAVAALAHNSIGPFV